MVFIKLKIDMRIFGRKKIDYKRNFFLKLEGLVNNLIRKKSDVRIAVILHLFYMESWKEIKLYLDFLKPYKTDLYVTYVEGFENKYILEEILNSGFQKVELIKYENHGFDIGSFIDVLNKIDLDNYDVVYKLHSKGIKRSRIFIYHQIFKNRDWFENLYNGLFGILKTDNTIKLLTNHNDIGLVAAENLIVSDPLHKQSFTLDISKTLNIDLSENYNYVCGTCFAIRSSLLKQIKNLGISIKDFEKTERGVFSLAHAMERIVCAVVEKQGYKLFGNKTKRNEYNDELEKFEQLNSERLLYDKRFKIDYDFFYRFLELRQIDSYEIVDIRLCDIKRKFNNKIFRLDEVSPFKFLNGDREAYKQYCNLNKKLSVFDNMSIDRYEKLCTSLCRGTIAVQIYTKRGKLAIGKE